MTSEKLRQQFEGQLYKYTNVMKGWQYRWFILDPESGLLNYFLNDVEHKQRPRGFIHLAGAVVSPSDEDSNTFTVNSATGDMFKLRAADARSRQEWVNRMRAVAEMHTMAIAQSNPPLSPREHHAVPLGVGAGIGAGGGSPAAVVAAGGGVAAATQQGPRVHCSLAVLDAFSTVREHIHRAEQSNFSLTRAIEELPSSGAGGGARSIDPDLLLMKATSQATLLCLGQCLFILQQQQVTPGPSSGSMRFYGNAPAGHQAQAQAQAHQPLAKKNSAPTSTSSTSSSFRGEQTKKSLQHEFSSSAWLDPLPPPTPNRQAQALTHRTDGIDCPATSTSHSNVASLAALCSPADELTDREDEEEAAATAPGEEHRSVIVHLLSQLKLGMDLTRVVLPTFILERRSLLELFADCMGHPDLFLRITELDCPQARMKAVLSWYLTSFHMGRKSSVAKKPYNPLMGETFHCSWRVPCSPGGAGDAPACVLRYTAEQVSHHPPVTAFYIECAERGICLNASIWTKSNFSGMSVGVNMVGDMCLHLGARNERYDLTLPAAYARSIINVPWIELGGKVALTCQQTGYAANIVFHTKPFYGGKVNQVTAEVKDVVGQVICRVQGEWNRAFEFAYENGEVERIDVNQLAVFPKRVRRLSHQGEYESRKLWFDVTRALHDCDIELATDYKRNLEERQRMEERIRREKGAVFPAKYFHKVDDSWVFNKMLINVM